MTRRAELAGLGYVAHGLRRTAASIFHNATTPDGTHRYDLLDIQEIPDHANPATTQSSYWSRQPRHRSPQPPTPGQPQSPTPTPAD
ncbi:MAG: hypothetical protein ACYDEN_12370, partial [Acidimicrobiales bacterium]